jgi:hypothetical protein
MATAKFAEMLENQHLAQSNPKSWSLTLSLSNEKQNITIKEYAMKKHCDPL